MQRDLIIELRILRRKLRYERHHGRELFVVGSPADELQHGDPLQCFEQLVEHGRVVGRAFVELLNLGQQRRTVVLRQRRKQPQHMISIDAPEHLRNQRPFHFTAAKGNTLV